MMIVVPSSTSDQISSISRLVTAMQPLVQLFPRVTDALRPGTPLGDHGS